MNLVVCTTSWTATTGTLAVNGRTYPCTLGRTGVIAAAEKREGDGKTPLGVYPLRQLIYRADRVAKPDTGLPVAVLAPDTGWCEDPAHADYNRKVTLPHPAAVDRMTRDDHLYDYVIVIGYNDDPPVPGRGSAIFLHHARPEFTPTQGCIGLRPADILQVLKSCGTSSKIDIRSPDSL